MKRIAILGCENSHANNFLTLVKERERYSDVEVVGVFSEEREAAEKLREKFGVPILEDFAEAKGKIDGLIITARHGDNHYKFARPYLEDKIPMFIDKPITISEDEAVSFMRDLRCRGIRFSGGSSLKHADTVLELKEHAAKLTAGKTLGGVVRAPLASDSEYGGFYFYAQHLVEMVSEIYGRYPKSVITHRKGGETTVVFRYEDFDVIGSYFEHSSQYFAARYAEKGSQGGVVDISNRECFVREFEEFYKLLEGSDSAMSYEDFIAPVFVMNAIERSLNSGKEETVKEFVL